MSQSFYIIGTDTNVGKTVVSAGLIHLLSSRGSLTCYFKPVSSGGFVSGNRFVSDDVSYVRGIAEFDESDEIINPFRFKMPASPHLASRMENKKIDKNIILEHYRQLVKKYDYLVVEGCGGLAVPLTDEGYMQYDLIKELGIGCILVARTTLGTINHTLLTIIFARSMGIPLHGIIFNGYNGSSIEDDNVKMLENLSGIPVLSVIPKMENISVEERSYGELKAAFEKLIPDINFSNEISIKH